MMIVDVVDVALVVVLPSVDEWQYHRHHHSIVPPFSPTMSLNFHDDFVGDDFLLLLRPLLRSLAVVDIVEPVVGGIGSWQTTESLFVQQHFVDFLHFDDFDDFHDFHHVVHDVGGGGGVMMERMGWYRPVG